MIRTRRALIVVCVALLAATAGCSLFAGGAESPTPSTATAGSDVTPTATATPTPTVTATPAPERPDSTATPAASGVSAETVTVLGNLSVNATLAFERVERLHGVDADSPTVVVGDGESRTVRSFDSPFYRTFGVTGSVTAAGQSVASDEVFLDADIENVDTRRTETVLVHEFAHTIHRQQRWIPLNSFRSAPDDKLRAVSGVVEGSAVYVTDEYVKAHAESLPRQSAEMERGYNGSAPAYRIVAAPYIAGTEYVDSRVDSPSELEPVMRTPPETTEQLLHPDRNVSVGNLTVSPVDGDWSVVPGHYPSEADRRGELLVRELLRLELDREVADAAANGWDNDRSLSLVSPDGNETALAWTLRWENSTEADEFAAAFDRFADRRSENVSAAFATERVAPETVVVLAGNETFVEDATVSGTNESVRVVAPGANETGRTATAEPRLGQPSTSRHPTTPQSAKP